MSDLGKKVLAIQGSYRKSSKTTKMLNYAVEEAIKQGHEVSNINLFDMNIEFCKGCKMCDQLGECINKKDDISYITYKVREADVIILASPVYWANLPAIVKNLFDRLTGAAMKNTERFPIPKLIGKRYILLTSCNTPMPFAALCGQSSGLKRAVKEFFKTAGVKKIGCVVCDNDINNKEISNRKFAKIKKLVEEI